MPTLEENVNRVKAAKTAIGNAITAKGGTVGANDGLEDFASDIASIPSGGGSSGLSLNLKCTPITTSNRNASFVNKTWIGLTNFNKENIWTDGENIYHTSGSSNQYALDRQSSTWYTRKWDKSLNAQFIWTDGKDIYLSNASTQYVLSKETGLNNLPSCVRV